VLRNLIRAVLAAACTLSMVCSVRAASPLLSENLLPNATKGYISIRNVNQLAEAWDKTELARLLDDPVMKPFGDDLRQQVKEKLLKSQDKLALSWDDLDGLASGEVSVALVHLAGSKPSLVVLVDVSGNAEKAQAVLEKAGATLTGKGAKRAVQDVGGTSVTVYTFPVRSDEKVARQAFYFLKNNLLVACDQLAVTTQIVKRFTGKHTDTLANVPAYKSVMQRCAADARELAPHVRWFAEPLGFAEAWRLTQEHRRPGGTDFLKVARNQGFSAILGVGGFVNFAEGQFGVLHRTAIFAPPEYVKAMRMLSFPNGGKLLPEAWVSRDVTAYSGLEVDVKNAFERFSTLFNELFGEGEDVFEDVIKSVELDPNGPGINIRRDLIAHMGQRVSIIVDYKLPITTESERRLFAVEATNAAALALAIEKSMKNDPNVKKHQVRGHDVWETLGEQNAAPKLIIEHPAGAKGNKVQGDKKPPAKQAAAVNWAITVVDGRLLIASHVDMLDKFLKPIEARETLAHDVDYQLVTAALEKLGGTGGCAQRFVRTDEMYFVNYELFKQGKLPEASTPMAKVLNILLGDEQEGMVRKPKLDGSKLPDFDVVRRYLGPAGASFTSEPNGWFIVGFTLNKEIPLMAGKAPAPGAGPSIAPVESGSSIEK
jgi:hypothetical protein